MNARVVCGGQLNSKISKISTQKPGKTKRTYIEPKQCQNVPKTKPNQIALYERRTSSCNANIFNPNRV